MHLLLINPSNPLVSIVNLGESRWNSYRVWQPLSLMALAGLTPREWEVAIVDENLGMPDYSAMPRPDLVGITAFTSQAGRAYVVAAHFRRLGVPVVMGGIHATMCLEEVSERVEQWSPERRKVSGPRFCRMRAKAACSAGTTAGWPDRGDPSGPDTICSSRATLLAPFRLPVAAH